MHDTTHNTTHNTPTTAADFERYAVAMQDGATYGTTVGLLMRFDSIDGVPRWTVVDYLSGERHSTKSSRKAGKLAARYLPEPSAERIAAALARPMQVAAVPDSYREAGLDYHLNDADAIADWLGWDRCCTAASLNDSNDCDCRDLAPADLARILGTRQRARLLDLARDRARPFRSRNGHHLAFRLWAAGCLGSLDADEYEVGRTSWALTEYGRSVVRHLPGGFDALAEGDESRNARGARLSVPAVFRRHYS